MTAPAKISKIERLRARDGGLCWLCHKPIDFNAEPNSSRAPTLEHLVPESRGGPDTLHNLVLCHPSCNAELDDRTVADKVRLREMRLEQRWRAAMAKRIANLLIDRAAN